MSQALPPLAAIRVFEAAARHGHFTRAAEELGMTQAAVSYQIKLLEGRLGTALFLRQPRKVMLTEAGRRLAPAVSDAFDRLKAVFADVAGGAEGTLTVSVVTTFAVQWLVPRLGTFNLAHPDLAVRLDTSAELVDFNRRDVDLAIRAGGGDWPGLRAHLLVRARFTPMLGPKLAERIGGVATPAELLRLPLIDPGDPWWRRWFDAAGVSGFDPDGQPRSRLGVQTLDAVAAMAGQGVAILTPELYRTECADGRLVQPFDLVLDDGEGYYLVYPESRRNNPRIRAFRDWLLGELGASGAAG